jgi:hypothetical protein
MCHFITLILPSGIRTNEIEVIGKKHRGRGFKLTPVQSRRSESWLKLGETQFLTRDKGCDCGTSLGTNRPDVKLKHKDWTVEARKLRAKGWGAHKIERWLAEKRHDQESLTEPDIDDTAPLTQAAHENDDWFGLLSELLDTKQVKYAGLLVHWSNDKIRSRTRINLRDRGIARLLEMEENVIYEFY